MNKAFSEFKHSPKYNRSFSVKIYSQCLTKTSKFLRSVSDIQSNRMHIDWIVSTLTTTKIGLLYNLKYISLREMVLVTDGSSQTLPNFYTGIALSTSFFKHTRNFFPIDF